MTKRGVSDVERAKVKERSRGYCELFHVLPSPGNQIVHTMEHQGLGGAASDAPCNQANVLLFGCQSCHDRLHGPGMPWKVARIDLILADWDPEKACHAEEGYGSEGLLEILDDSNRLVPHEEIFFHQLPSWIEAFDRYPELTTKLAQWNTLGYEVAELLAFFAPEKGKPMLWNVCEEYTPNPHLTPKEEFRRFAPHIGMPGSKLMELAAIGQWGMKDGLGEILSGADLDALDALRSVAKKVDAAELVELASMAKADPRGFWDEVDKIRCGKRRRPWVITRDDGSMSVTKTVEQPPLADDEALIRGTVVVGAGRVKDADA